MWQLLKLLSIMAKVGAMQRGWKGKTAGIVYAKGETGTIARELVTPKNPRTRLQMSQRIIFATVMQAAKILKPLINHSFEGVAYGNKSVREFTSRNIARLRQFAALDFEETPSAVDARAFMTTKGVQALVPNMYRISNGSLAGNIPDIVTSQVFGHNTTAGNLYFRPNAMIAGNVAFKLHPVNGTAKGIKLGELLEWMFGLGTTASQISVVVIGAKSHDNAYVYGNDDTAPGFVIRNTVFRVLRAVVDSTVDLNEVVQVTTAEGTAIMESALENIQNAVSAALLVSDRSSVAFVEHLAEMMQDSLHVGNVITDDGAVNLSWTIDDHATYSIQDSSNVFFGAAGYWCLAGGVIASKQVEGSWRRSTCDMTIVPCGSSEATNYGLTWNLAVDAWFAGQVLADTTEYLNEGGDMNELS